MSHWATCINIRAGPEAEGARKKMWTRVFIMVLEGRTKQDSVNRDRIG